MRHRSNYNAVDSRQHVKQLLLIPVHTLEGEWTASSTSVWVFSQAQGLCASQVKGTTLLCCNNSAESRAPKIVFVLTTADKHTMRHALLPRAAQGSTDCGAYSIKPMSR